LSYERRRLPSLRHSGLCCVHPRIGAQAGTRTTRGPD